MFTIHSAYLAADQASLYAAHKSTVRAAQRTAQWTASVSAFYTTVCPALHAT